MPSYTYHCRDCGATFSDMASIEDRNVPVDCACGSKADRNVEAELAASNGCQAVTDNIRWSRSMGVPPKSLEAYRKRFPNSTYSDDGRLLIKNRKDKLRQVAERDMVELNDKR